MINSMSQVDEVRFKGDDSSTRANRTRRQPRNKLNFSPSLQQLWPRQLRILSVLWKACPKLLTQILLGVRQDVIENNQIVDRNCSRDHVQ